jgi:hypothetical protein
VFVVFVFIRRSLLRVYSYLYEDHYYGCIRIYTKIIITGVFVFIRRSLLLLYSYLYEDHYYGCIRIYTKIIITGVFVFIRRSLLRVYSYLYEDHYYGCIRGILRERKKMTLVSVCINLRFNVCMIFCCCLFYKISFCLLSLSIIPLFTSSLMGVSNIWNSKCWFGSCY